jgi:hypothetical protein
MNREKALKILLVVLGLLFVAGIYPLVMSVRSGWQANKEDALPMMLTSTSPWGFSCWWQCVTRQRIAA